MVVAAPPNIREIEVFRSGTHTSSNGTTLSFTQDHLHQIANSYDPKVHEAPVIVGHAYATSPAYGWVDSLKVVGDRLVARIKDLEPQFAELVKARRYSKISSGLYPPESPSNPYPGNFSLREVSFLGAQPPAIKGLKPVEFAEEEGVLHFDEQLNFMHGEHFIATILQRLRDYLIDSGGLDAADKALPAGLVQMVYESANMPDRDNEQFYGLLADLAARVDNLEQNLSPIYSETVNFAATKMFGQSGKKKSCTKGTPCGVGCINGNKTCRKGVSEDTKDKIKNLKSSVKSRKDSNNNPTNKSKDTDDALSKSKSGLKGDEAQIVNQKTSDKIGLPGVSVSRVNGAIDYIQKSQDADMFLQDDLILQHFNNAQTVKGKSKLADSYLEAADRVLAELFRKSTDKGKNDFAQHFATRRTHLDYLIKTTYSPVVKAFAEDIKKRAQTIAEQEEEAVKKRNKPIKNSANESNDVFDLFG